MKIGFDLDGTLITCQQKQCQLMEHVAKKHNVSMNVTAYWILKRNGFSNIEALHALGFSDSALKILSTGWLENVETDEWLKKDQLFDFTLEVLTLLKKNHSLYLISARSNADMALKQLTQLRLTDFLSNITFVDPQKKQAKADYLKSNQIDLYIGDTELDYQNAVLANTKIMIVSSGQRSWDFLYNKTNQKPYLHIKEVLSNINT